MIDYHALLPELILAVTVLAVLVVDLTVRDKYWSAVVALIGLFLAFIPLLTLFFCDDLAFCTVAGPERVMFGGSYVVDDYALVLKGLFLGTAFVALLLSVGYVEGDRYYQGEFYFLLLASALGAVVMASSRDFITLIVALELVSAPAFLLAGWRKADEKSNEAALKFFIFGVLSLALLVFGIGMIYGLTGTQTFASLAASTDEVASMPLFTLGVVFILLGFGFKISAVPFHYWAPDTYQGAPTPVTAWLSVGSKAAGFVGLLSVCYLALPAARNIWGPALWIVAALSMSVGNIVAIKQTNLVRLLGYSSIAQAGFMLAPFGAAAAADAGAAELQAAFFATVTYLLIFAFMNLGAFAVVIAGSSRLRSTEIRDWSGLWRYAPGLAVMLAIFFLSLAGIPPLAGWFAKLVMFQALIAVGAPWGTTLAAIAAINTVVALVYYAKVVKTAFFDQVPELAPVEELERGAVAPALRLALLITAVSVVVLGVFPGIIANIGELTMPFAAGL